MPTSLKRLTVARLSPLLTAWREPELFASVRAFCLFVGHGRSGGTLVGALLNAHPNAVITNELDALAYIEKGLTQRQLFNLLYRIDKRLVRKGSTGGGGYTYGVPGQWQGRHQTIEVIGDRKAGATALEIATDPAILDRLRQWADVDVRFVNVVRNPYDNIVTTFEKTTRQPGEAAESHMRREIDRYFERCAAVERVVDVFGADKVKRVFHEEMVTATETCLAGLCGFFDLPAPPDYLAACAGIVQPRARVTRHSYEWSDELIELVASRMAAVPWLDRYSFDDAT